MPYNSIDKTEVIGVYRIQPKVFGDERGWYCPNVEFSELEKALKISFRNITQLASSYNSKAGILRGMHYQLSPNTQGKLVMATRGSVLDVALDVRKNSPTFGKYITAILTSTNQNQLWVPPGCAHGYLALEPNTTFSYIVTDGKYSPDLERGVNPFDPNLNIPWGMSRESMDLKERDLNLRNFEDIPKDELL